MWKYKVWIVAKYHQVSQDIDTNLQSLVSIYEIFLCISSGNVVGTLQIASFMCISSGDVGAGYISVFLVTFYTNTNFTCTIVTVNWTAENRQFTSFTINVSWPSFVFFPETSVIFPPFVCSSSKSSCLAKNVCIFVCKIMTTYVVPVVW